MRVTDTMAGIINKEGTSFSFASCVPATLARPSSPWLRESSYLASAPSVSRANPSCHAMELFITWILGGGAWALML